MQEVAVLERKPVVNEETAMVAEPTSLRPMQPSNIIWGKTTPKLTPLFGRSIIDIAKESTQIESLPTFTECVLSGSFQRVPK